MNTIIQALLDRRSIRKYKTTPVAKEQIDTLLQAAFYAPSSKNIHPCHFIVIDDKETLNSFNAFHVSAKMFDTAPLAIIVCGDAAEAWATWRDDCASASANICNAAHALGLGSCWCGLYPRDARVDGMKAALKLPGHIMPYSMIVIGHPDEVKSRPERDLAHKVHINKW